MVEMTDTTKPSEMVERVASAICRRNTLLTLPTASAETLRNSFDLGRKMWTDMACAAIEAMREPTEAMAEAGEEMARSDGAHDCEVHMADVYAAMIDAALGRAQPRPERL